MGTDYFRLHPWIGLLSNLPVLLGALGIALLAWSPFRRLLDRHPILMTALTYVATRFLFLYLVVGVLRHVSHDLPTYFETQGQAVLRGAIPYRDFTSSYAPLFPYLMAFPAALPGTNLPFFLAFTVADLAALLILSATAGLENRSWAVRAGWLYTIAPVTWFFLIRYAQDESLAALFLVTAYLLMRSKREASAAILLGLGFAATKFTFGIFIPPFLIAARRRIPFALMAAAAAGLAFAPFALTGAPVWQPLTTEGAGLGFGPSVWRIPVVFTPLTVGWPASLVLALALLLLWGVAAGRRPTPPLATLLLATGLLFLVLSPKVLPMYITPFWPFACLWLARAGEPRDYILAGGINLLLGTWWYFDAGAIQGMFGPWVQGVSVVVTAAVPLALSLLLARADRHPGPVG